MPGHLGLFVCLTVALNIFIRRPRLWAIYDLHTANEELGLIIYTNPCVRSDTGCRQPLFKTNGPGVNSTTPDVWVFQPHSGKNSVLNVGSKNITGQLFFILAKMRNGICKVGPRIFFFFFVTLQDKVQKPISSSPNQSFIFLFAVVLGLNLISRFLSLGVNVALFNELTGSF